MSLEIDPLAPVQLPTVEPAPSAAPHMPESSSTLDASASVSTLITAQVDLGSELASETLSQLQTQANTGDLAAIDELAWRADHERFQPPEFTEPSPTNDLLGLASSEERDKGMQIDETF